MLMMRPSPVHHHHAWVEDEKCLSGFLYLDGSGSFLSRTPLFDKLGRRSLPSPSIHFLLKTLAHAFASSATQLLSPISHISSQFSHSFQESQFSWDSLQLVGFYAQEFFGGAPMRINEVGRRKMLKGSRKARRKGSSSKINSKLNWLLCLTKFHFLADLLDEPLGNSFNVLDLESRFYWFYSLWILIVV